MATPKLRFKEFNNQWDKTTINDQAQTVTSGSRDWAQYYSESGDKFIRMTNLVRDGIYLDLSDLKFVQLPKDSNEGKRTSLKFGDILISITAELGKLGWIPQGLGTAYINQHTALVRMKDSVDSKFVAYSLSTEKYNNKLNSLNDSGAKAGLNLGTIRNFELIVPPKEEQTKIASLLSIVDEKISQLTQKNFLLSQYKQGMMQKLFSQQIRFKAVDGSEFGEWEEKKLSEICLKIKDGTHFSPKTFEVGEYKYLTSKNVKNGYLDFSNLEFVSTDDHKKIYSSCDVKFGDVLLTKDGTIGQCCVNTLTEEFSLLSSVAFLRLKSEFNNYFLYHILLSDLGQKEINGAIAGQALKRITLTKINDFKFMFPCLAEQTKIANFLSAIDQKIEVVAQQIEQAKTWKKGLLQQMFV